MTFTLKKRWMWISNLCYLILISMQSVWAAPFAYIPCQNDNIVSIIDMSNNTVIKTLTVDKPFNAAVTPDGSRVYISSWYTITVIDGNSNQTVDTFDLPQYYLNGNYKTPEIQDLAVSPDGLWLYAAISGAIGVINTQVGDFETIVPVGQIPSHIAISPDGDRVYVTNIEMDKTLVVMDTTNNTVIKTIDSMTGIVPHTLVVSADNSKLYVGTWFDGIKVIDTENYQTLATIPISDSEDIAISPDNAYLYIAKFGTIYVIDSTTHQIIRNFSSSFTTNGLATYIEVTSDGSRLYGLSDRSDDNRVVVFDTSTGNVIDSITVGARPTSKGPFIARGPSHATPIPTPVDNTNPDIRITSPTSYSSYSTSYSTLTVRGDASDQGQLNRIEFYLNGSHVDTLNISSTSYNWSKTFSLQRGRNSIIAKAYDASENWQSATLTVNKVSTFRTYPQIEVIEAPSTARVGQSYSIKVQ